MEIHGIKKRHTTCLPIAARARRLSPVQLSVNEKTFKELESLGIVRRSNSHGPAHSIWFPNQMVVGGHAVAITQGWANLDQAHEDLDRNIFRDLSPTPKP
jgi:hypothetical protein